MEPRDLKNPPVEFEPSLNDTAKSFYEKAVKFTDTFYRSTIEKFRALDFNLLTPEFFFNETIWVIHATGFNAAVVGRMMPRLLNAYGSYNSLSAMTTDQITKLITPICNNPQKIKAVHKNAIILNDGINRLGWPQYKEEALYCPSVLTSLPFIGKVTCYHLARNIGLLDSVKPDLHLIRLASYWRYDSCWSMCNDMRTDNTPLGIVDLILWYYSSTYGTLIFRADGQR